MRGLFTVVGRFSVLDADFFSGWEGVECSLGRLIIVIVQHVPKPYSKSYSYNIVYKIYPKTCMKIRSGRL